MIHVTHDGHDGSSCEQIALVVNLLGDGLLHFGRDVFCGEAELLGHDVDGLSVEALVDRHHDADRHTGADDLVDADVHHRS